MSRAASSDLDAAGLATVESASNIVCPRGSHPGRGSCGPTGVYDVRVVAACLRRCSCAVGTRSPIPVSGSGRQIAQPKAPADVRDLRFRGRTPQRGRRRGRGDVRSTGPPRTRRFRQAHLGRPRGRARPPASHDHRFFSGRAEPDALEDESVWVVHTARSIRTSAPSELERAGHRFASVRTEVIVHAYEEWGDGTSPASVGCSPSPSTTDVAGRGAYSLAPDRSASSPSTTRWTGIVSVFGSELNVRAPGGWIGGRTIRPSPRYLV